VRSLASPRHQPHHPVDRRALDAATVKLDARLGELQRGPLVLKRALDQPLAQRLELDLARGREPGVFAHRETMLPARRHAHGVFEDRARRHVQRARHRSDRLGRRGAQIVGTNANRPKGAVSRRRRRTLVCSALPAQSVLEVPPALAQPAADLVAAALPDLPAIACQSADRLLEPALGSLAGAFCSFLASAPGHVGLLQSKSAPRHSS
jgi:hypothetical protein